jgi:hypothetical protein
MLEEPFVHTKATLDVPNKPGLGIEIDRRSLKRWGKRFFKMDRKRLVFFALRDRGLKAAREMDRAKRGRLGSD